MAESLPSPPQSRNATPSVEDSVKVLTERLDTLLEQYLELLDNYMTLRDELSGSFSSGFLSLAQAQRNSSLGPGRRYGEEFYDERMKAQRQVKIRTTQTKGGLQFTISKPSLISGSENPNPDPTELAVSQVQEMEQVTETEQGRNSSQDSAIPTETPNHTKRILHSSQDPLKWFGILVPPALRQTQAIFSCAVETSIPSLISVHSTMTELESEIYKVRKELGLDVE